MATGVDAGTGAAAGVDAGSGLDAGTGAGASGAVGFEAVGADAAGAGVVGSDSVGVDAPAGALAGIATGMMGLATAVGSALDPPPHAARQMLSPAIAAALQPAPDRYARRAGASFRECARSLPGPIRAAPSW
jgi:hypothetical protein